MSEKKRRIRLTRRMDGPWVTGSAGDIIDDVLTDEAEALIAIDWAEAVEEPALDDAGPDRNPPSTGPFSDEEWRRGIKLEDWTEWRSPGEEIELRPDAATLQRLRGMLRADIAAGAVELGVPPDSVCSAVQRVSADALDEIIDALGFSSMTPGRVYFGGKWTQIRVYRAGRFTDVLDGDASGAKVAPMSGRQSGPRDAPPPPTASVERRGAKPKYDWDDFWAELARVVHDDGVPATQTELENLMLEWCGSEWGEEPSRASVRKRVSKAYRRLRPD